MEGGRGGDEEGGGAGGIKRAAEETVFTLIEFELMIFKSGHYGINHDRFKMNLSLNNDT